MPRHSRIFNARIEWLRWCMVCVGWLGTSFGTAAQERAFVEVEWSAPPDCPDRAAMLRILEARMHGRRVQGTLQARAKILRRGARYRLVLELDSQNGRASRSLTDQRCEPLVEAAAVLIALALETEAAGAAQGPKPAELPSVTEAPLEEEESAAQAPAPAPSQTPEASTTAEPQAPAAPPSEQDIGPGAGTVEITHDAAGVSRAPRRLHLQLTAALRADLGSFPHQPALGVQAQLAARFRPFYLALGATYWPARDQRSLSYTNARLRGSGWFADLSLGVDLPASQVLLTPALAAELGQLVAEAVGIVGPERNRVLWLALGPSVSAALRIQKNWEIALELAGLVPVYRNHWRVLTPQGDVPAFDAAPIVVRAALRIGYLLR